MAFSVRNFIIFTVSSNHPLTRIKFGMNWIQRIVFFIATRFRDIL